MQEMGWSPNIVIYTPLNDECCKNGDLERAKILFRGMEELGLVTNQYTYTILIDWLFKKELQKDAFEMDEKMQLNGIGIGRNGLPRIPSLAQPRYLDTVVGARRSLCTLPGYPNGTPTMTCYPVEV
ncbi:hypothetical protein Ddye_016507 [Dipteronia dyeriana]|uniref:Pentatricopeptide repeat-containing protein n=1 Tax=Dipteronia dyeriana TaxID=168575 RepID=A0AAD9U7J2_9ROSI|nr:hypothetical protein Ddye_016507 [Dipteronia dyeriana]